MALQPIDVRTLPLAWAYICARTDTRRAFDRYQREAAERFGRAAGEALRQAVRAGGQERDAALRAAKVLRDRMDINDPGQVGIILAVGEG